jgi:hypothetical protein
MIGINVTGRVLKRFRWPAAVGSLIFVEGLPATTAQAEEAGNHTRL